MSTIYFTHNQFNADYSEGLVRDINKIEKHPTYDQAISIYQKARERLLDINAWSNDARICGFEYTLRNEDGELKSGYACEGDFITFKEDGDNYNEVQIERILEVTHDDWKSFALRVKSLPDGDTHTLIVERKGNKVISYVHERSLHTNKLQARGGLFSEIWDNLFKSEKAEDNVEHHWETLIDIIME